MEKATLDFGSTKKVDPNSLYLVDFSKITSVQSLILIFAAMGISFSTHHPQFEVVKEFLNLDNPIPMQPQQPQHTDIKLPKLKPVK